MYVYGPVLLCKLSSKYRNIWYGFTAWGIQCDWNGNVHLKRWASRNSREQRSIWFPRENNRRHEWVSNLRCFVSIAPIWSRIYDSYENVPKIAKVTNYSPWRNIIPIILFIVLSITWHEKNIIFWGYSSDTRLRLFLKHVATSRKLFKYLIRTRHSDNEEKKPTKSLQRGTRVWHLNATRIKNFPNDPIVTTKSGVTIVER